MTPFQMSVLSWLGGGVAGAVVAKEHRVAGFALGAILVGAVSDKLIERDHPAYGRWPQLASGRWQ